MPSFLSDVASNLVFKEPSGWRTSLVQFGSALAYLGIYVYAWSRGESGLSAWLLLMVVGTALAGTAELLPTERRYAAGVLRLAGILLLVSLVGVTLFAPSVLFDV